jgi:hypothetical protein
MRYPFVVATTMMLFGCGSSSLQMPPGVDWHRYVTARGEDSDLASLRLRPDVCEGYDLRPDYATLNEATFVRFLERQRFDVQAQRQQVDPKNPELHYVFVRISGIAEPVALRVAVLPNQDEAGRVLREAVLERGAGSWGVHRGNVAVLGPIGSSADDIAFAASTKLACWGTFTIADTDDAFVIPGGYAEP